MYQDVLGLNVMTADKAAGEALDRATQDYLTSLQKFGSTGSNDAAKTTAQIAYPLAEALMACGAGDYAGTVDRLLPIRHDLIPIGGSHAQQDIFHQILIDSAMRADRADLARSLLKERAVLRPGGAWAHQRHRVCG